MSEPNIVDKLISLTKSVAIHVSSGAKSASDEEQVKRAELCGECPALDPDKYKCMECGCNLKYKLKWVTSKCPLGKW